MNPADLARSLGFDPSSDAFKRAFEAKLRNHRAITDRVLKAYEDAQKPASDAVDDILSAHVGYYTERESPMGWALFCSPGDNGYPSRFVAHLDTPTRAERCAQTLQYIAGQYGAAQARECERAAVEVARA